MKLSETRLGPILSAVKERAEQRCAAGNLERLLTAREAQLAQRSALPAGQKNMAATSGRAFFCNRLETPGLAIIAEHKRVAPSAGQLAACGEQSDSQDVEKRCAAYAQGGAAALSILTEEDFFAGSLNDLQRAESSGLPRLRKDFLLNEWMVRESAAAGADAILLLAVCLPGSALSEMTALAHELDLAVLCEIHDPEELQFAVAAQPDCIGVNARDLRTFEINLDTTLQLLPQVPNGFVRVAESGIHEFEHLLAVRNAGADAALIGTAFMRYSERLGRWTTRLSEGENR
jgi:indole-3-glycerol phosphate synthase